MDTAVNVFIGVCFGLTVFFVFLFFVGLVIKDRQ